jgi:hypothetical protein
MEDVGIVAPTPSFARLASMSAKSHEVGDHVRVSMGIYGREIVDATIKAVIESIRPTISH